MMYKTIQQSDYKTGLKYFCADILNSREGIIHVTQKVVFVLVVLPFLVLIWFDNHDHLDHHPDQHH